MHLDRGGEGSLHCWEATRVVGQVPRELTPLESALYFFGAELRHWRTVRELSQAALGRLTHDSGALIGKIEKCERFPRLRKVNGFLGALTSVRLLQSTQQ
jgi:hypothetical protein